MSAGEWANLLGATFGYWGTILLGTLAFWQNENSNEISKRLLDLDEIDRKIANSPDIQIVGIEIYTPTKYESPFKVSRDIRDTLCYESTFLSIPDDYNDCFEVGLLIQNTSKIDIYNLTYNGHGVFVQDNKRNLGIPMY